MIVGAKEVVYNWFFKLSKRNTLALLLGKTIKQFDN